MTTAVFDEASRDARGVPITVGATVIYGAPVGRSIALVEGTVVGFTKSGRVNIRVIRRAYGGWYSGKDVVHVGHDRLVIVNDLPESNKPTDKEKQAQTKLEMAERERVFSTHSRFIIQDPNRTWRASDDPCMRCGITYNQAHRTECTSE
jgi:hypothetical protein